MALYWTRYEKIIFITLACIVLPEKLSYFLYTFQVSLEIESDNWNKVSCFFYWRKDTRIVYLVTFT